ncbi:MAG: isoleucine--tRNA ligase [Candidatus Norongarragalinales archaeon]
MFFFLKGRKMVYNPKSIEEKTLAKWKHENTYATVKQKFAGKPKFFFMDGPPYATGYIHMGTALNKTLKDSFIRFFRMQGHAVWDQPGYDCHGTPIEVKTEKKFGFKNKKDIVQFGVGKFVGECRHFATEYIDVMNSQFANLGVWLDWEKPYLTLDNSYVEGIWFTFKKAFEKGLVYKGNYPVHVCTRCETVVAFNEIEYKTVKDPAVFVKFKLAGKNEFFVIYTTTPWTLPSNMAIMVHPDFDYARVKLGGEGGEILVIAKDLVGPVLDSTGRKYEIIGTLKGSELAGMRYEHPFADKVPMLQKLSRESQKVFTVVASARFVSVAEGTGLVHSAPGHGKEDFAVGKENSLPIACPMGLDGIFRSEAGAWIAGKYAKQADKIILETLSERNALLKVDTISHEYPKCWRCDTSLLILNVPQWFIRIDSMLEQLKSENEKVNWVPGWASDRFADWLENLKDWPVTRQRYWGAPAPIWECGKCGKVEVIGTVEEMRGKSGFAQEIDLHLPGIDAVKWNCSCGGVFTRIPDVLDVWFDSGVASWVSLGYPSQKEKFEKLWPCDLQIEGVDQIRGWWNSQLITSMITFDKAPFKNIVFHGFVLDAHGSKMSKSLGNIVAPEDVIEKFGRDALRLFFLDHDPSEDFSFAWDGVEQVNRFLNVFWNTFVFVQTYAPRGVSTKIDFASLSIEDKWILAKLQGALKFQENGRKFKLYETVAALKAFVLDDFSRTYIKLVRDRVSPSYSGKDKQSAQAVLRAVMETLTKAFAPFTPFVCEEMFSEFSDAQSVHAQDYPRAEKSLENELLEKQMAIVLEIVEASSALRQEAKIKLRWPVRAIAVETQDEETRKAVSALKKTIEAFANAKVVTLGSLEGSEVKSAGFSKGKVFLDCGETPDLVEERLMREVSRAIQEMRKSKGLNVGEKAKVFIDGPSEFVGKWKEYLEKETNSTLEPKKAGESKFTVVSLRDFEVKIAL